MSMTSSHIALIGYPCGAGAQIIQCAMGPEALQLWGLEQRLREYGVKSSWQELPDLGAFKDPLKEVVAYNTRLYHDILHVLSHGHFPVILGGDHSSAIGCWSAVTDHYGAKQDMGLIWMDAHLDAHTHETSPSAALHGMPAAALLGRGLNQLVNIGTHGPKMAPEHLVYIGIRSYESEEYQLLHELGVKIVMMEEVRARGLPVIMDEVRAYLASKVRYIGVTIDLDAFDPDRAPGVGSPEKGGLLRQEVYESLAWLSSYPYLTALEIAEYNPVRGVDDKTKDIVLDLIRTITTPASSAMLGEH